MFCLIFTVVGDVIGDYPGEKVWIGDYLFDLDFLPSGRRIWEQRVGTARSRAFSRPKIKHSTDVGQPSGDAFKGGGIRLAQRIKRQAIRGLVKFGTVENF